MNNNKLSLENGAGENGRIVGGLVAPRLKRKIAAVRAAIAKAGYAETTIAARVADFTRVLSKLTPPWLEEAAGIAAGAKVDVNDLLALNCLPPDLFSRGGDELHLVHGGGGETEYSVQDPR